MIDGQSDEFVQFGKPARVLSPCVLVCVLDQATGWCLGCGRDGSEIAKWPLASDAQRQAILDLLPERMAQLR